jgi:hypothetical protein
LSAIRRNAMARRSHVKIESCSRSQTGSIISGSPNTLALFRLQKQALRQERPLCVLRIT